MDRDNIVRASKCKRKNGFEPGEQQSTLAIYFHVKKHTTQPTNQNKQTNKQWLKIIVDKLFL